VAGCLLSAEWPLGLFLFLNKPLAGLAEFAVFFGHKGFAISPHRSQIMADSSCAGAFVPDQGIKDRKRSCQAACPLDCESSTEGDHH